MEVNDVLDDILGAPSASPTDLQLPIPEVAPEKTSENIHEQIETVNLTGDQLQALEQCKTFAVYQKALESRTHLDKALAVEIFTMLPQISDDTLIHKLTNASSAHNRSLLQTQLGRHAPSPDLTGPLLDQLYQSSEDARQDVTLIEPVLAAFNQAVSVEYDRIRGQSQIVFARQQINVLDTPYVDMVKIDDTLIDFPPYAGVLINAFEEMRATAGFCALYHDLSEYCPSLDAIRARLRLAQTDVPEYLKQVQGAMYGDNGERTNEMVNMDFRRTVEAINEIKRWKFVTVTNTSFLDSYLKLLKILV